MCVLRDGEIACVYGSVCGRLPRPGSRGRGDMCGVLSDEEKKSEITRAAQKGRGGGDVSSQHAGIDSAFGSFGLRWRPVRNNRRGGWI